MSDSSNSDSTYSAPSTKAPQALADFGPVLGEFTVGRANAVAGAILTYGSFIVGLAVLVWIGVEAGNAPHPIPFEAKHGFCWGKGIAIGLFGLFAFGAGFFFKFYVGSLRSQRTYLCEHGVYFVSDNQGSGWSWKELLRVRETYVMEHLPLKGVMKYLVPVGRSLKFVLVHKDGREVAIDKNVAANLRRFGKILKQKAIENHAGWEVIDNSFFGRFDD